MKNKNSETKNIGHELCKALTEKQVERLLEKLLASVEKQALTEILSSLDDDITATVNRIVLDDEDGRSQPRSQESSQVLSDRKCMELWQQLWSDWWEIASEAGDEDGKYIVQERHWETPYFDGSMLTEDLEEVAEKMLPLLDEVAALKEEDDEVYLQACDEIESNVRLLPEWMGADSEGFALDYSTSTCILKWEWLVAKQQPRNGVKFVERIAGYEEELKLVGLDSRATGDFFSSLPESAKRRIYEYLTSNRKKGKWKERLDAAYSIWHEIYHDFSRTFDSDAYLVECRELLAQQWKYGLPLVEHAMEQKDYADAEQVLVETFQSYIKSYHRSNEGWDPRQTLLIHILRYGYGAPEDEIVRLLQYWAEVANQKKDVALKSVLMLQQATYSTPHDWDAVLGTFSEVDKPEFSASHKQLLRQWQEHILERSGSSIGESEGQLDESWIHWLHQTRLDGACDHQWFRDKVKRWLETLQDDAAEFKKQRRLIYFLTCDLVKLFSLQDQYPKLFKSVLESYQGPANIAASRRKFLQRMQMKPLVSLLMACWKNNIIALVPDPHTAHNSKYHDQAKWLLVVNELNPEACRGLIAQWRTDHHRRRNLWSAIQAAGLVSFSADKALFRKAIL